MALKLVPEDHSRSFVLDLKAFGFVIRALDAQIESWDAVKAEDMREDDFADLRNDIGYFECPLDNLKTRFTNS
jgi:hypothetical protein